MNLKALGITMLATGVILAQPASHAKDRRPLYISARRDLRRVQLLLRVPEEPKIGQNLKIADDEVEAAIRQMDRAAVVDREDLDDHPSVDLGVTRKERFVKIGELLRSARADINSEEDNPGTHIWRATALQHIYEALYACHLAGLEAGLEPVMRF